MVVKMVSYRGHGDLGHARLLSSGEGDSGDSDVVLAGRESGNTICVTRCRVTEFSTNKTSGILDILSLFLPLQFRKVVCYAQMLTERHDLAAQMPYPQS